MFTLLFPDGGDALESYVYIIVVILSLDASSTTTRSPAPPEHHRPRLHRSHQRSGFVAGITATAKSDNTRPRRCHRAAFHRSSGNVRSFSRRRSLDENKTDLSSSCPYHPVYKNNLITGGTGILKCVSVCAAAEAAHRAPLALPGGRSLRGRDPRKR